MQAVRVEPVETFETPPVGDLGPHVRGVIAAVALGFAVGVVGVLVCEALSGISDEVVYAPLLGAVAIAVWVAGRPGVIAALISSAFVSGLGPTVTTAIVFLVVAAIGFVVVFAQRRNYLREVRLGRVIERETWSGADLLPPG